MFGCEGLYPCCHFSSCIIGLLFACFCFWRWPALRESDGTHKLLEPVSSPGLPSTQDPVASRASLFRYLTDHASVIANKTMIQAHFHLSMTHQNLTWHLSHRNDYHIQPSTLAHSSYCFDMFEPVHQIEPPASLAFSFMEFQVSG